MKRAKLTLAGILTITLIAVYTVPAADMVAEGSVFGYATNANLYYDRVAYADDCVYVAGYTKGSLPGMPAGYGYGYNMSGVLVKYGPETEDMYEWARIFGSTNQDYAYGVDVDDEGNVFAAGTTEGTGGDKGFALSTDVMLVKFDEDGNNLWQRSWGSSSTEMARNVAVDDDGNAYVVGSTYGSFHGQTNSTGNKDIFVSKVTPEGSNEWTKIWGAEFNKKLVLTPADEAWDVDVDEDSNVYVAGTTDGDLLDGVANSYGYAAFLTKMDSDGNKEWTKIWGSGTGITAFAALGVSVDEDIIAVVGKTGGDIGEATNSGATDAYITLFDEDGSQLWTHVWGSEKDDKANDVVIEEGKVYVAGQTMGLFDREEESLETLGYGYGATIADNWNAFVSEFDLQDEARVWTRIWGSTNTEYATGIDIDDAENVYVSGYGNGAFHMLEDNNGLYFGFVSLWMWLDNSADFDGDGADDLTIFDPVSGLWYILSSLDDDAIQWGTQWGWEGAEPVAGDYDGDGVNDMAVFDPVTGVWYIQSVQGTIISWAQQWGWDGADPVHGDYDGDGADDMAVFDAENGYWYIQSVQGSIISWAQLWGWAGARPVAGDFDGDDRDDLAVFDTSDGSWYILSTRGTLIAWALNWGWEGAEPVTGDFDGDGADDLAVFDTTDGYWYILSLSGRVIAWAQQWGWAGAEPVSGDYDGDGADDLSVFDQETGLWYSISAQGRVIHWAKEWGWSGARPVAAE